MHPTGGSRRVFKPFAWLEVDSAKMAFPRPTHQRVTQAVRKTRGFFSAFGVLKYGFANHPVLLMMYFIGLGFFRSGVFFKMVSVSCVTLLTVWFGHG